MCLVTHEYNHTKSLKRAIKQIKFCMNFLSYKFFKLLKTCNLWNVVSSIIVKQTNRSQKVPGKSHPIKGEYKHFLCIVGT